jgi:membrane-associated phospholipid phosphatase
VTITLPRFLNYAKWIGLALVVFVIVYGLCNHYSSLQPMHYAMYFDWELSIPHVKEMMLAYRSLDLIFIVVLFALSEQSVRKLSLAMISSILMAAPIYLFFPAKLGFQRLVEFDQFETLYRVLYTLDRPHNLLPSMHVTYASIGLWAIMREHNSRQWVAPLLWIWLFLICASIILVHQHHLMDIPTGMLLAVINYKMFFKTE